MAGQLETPLLQEVTTTVEVSLAVEVRRVLLWRGLKTAVGGTEAEMVCRTLFKVAEGGAMGPVRMADVRRVLVGTGAKSLRLWTSSSTLAQL